jgi:hypothetical protein
MTGQLHQYVVGERVEVVIEMAEVNSVHESSVVLRVGEDVYLSVPNEAAGVTVRRMAPEQWPPLRGDLWRDHDGDLWFATTTATRYGDSGSVIEHARLVMAPAQETPNLYRDQRIRPEALLEQRGPVQLVHREPQPELDEEDL